MAYTRTTSEQAPLNDELQKPQKESQITISEEIISFPPTQERPSLVATYTTISAPYDGGRLFLQRQHRLYDEAKDRDERTIWSLAVVRFADLENAISEIFINEPPTETQLNQFLINSTRDGRLIDTDEYLRMSEPANAMLKVALSV